MSEHQYDKLLNIKTRADQGAKSTIHYHRYEPTPYEALDVLFETYRLSPADHVVDFGCGKGRLNFYLHFHFQCSVVGVEMDKALVLAAEENTRNYARRHSVSEGSISFHRGLAEAYPIKREQNRFYFFNPFSSQIFIKTVVNILKSAETHPRPLELVLYYPSEDYIYYLEDETPFSMKCEIPLTMLYKHNPYERFVVYGLEM